MLRLSNSFRIYFFRPNLKTHIIVYFISNFRLLLNIFAYLLRQMGNIGYLSFDYIYFIKLTLFEVLSRVLSRFYQKIELKNDTQNIGYISSVKSPFEFLTKLEMKNPYTLIVSDSAKNAASSSVFNSTFGSSSLLISG